MLLRGESEACLTELVDQCGAGGVFCSRQYTPWDSALEERLHQGFSSRGLELRRFSGSLLFEPEAVRNQSGLPFRVFTPFWKACLRSPAPKPPAGEPGALRALSPAPAGLDLADLQLLPVKPDWAAHWNELWRPGAEGAHEALQRFLRDGLDDYDEGRNFPARSNTSRLSPHLHFGEIAPNAVWHAAVAHSATRPELDHQRDKFLSELGWREFSAHLLHHFPDFPDKPFQRSFEAFPWLGTQEQLVAWQRGQTGYPIVDAGMRELWQTGYMHNRVRMITASFLTKHLLLPWQAGERWFHDTLVDADAANNSCSWQWVAGCGADAAPYFRIFNPTLQGKKFDPGGDYVRQWVPEIAQLPDRHLHEPAAAPPAVLEAAGVTLGETYPAPMVEHKRAREAALSAYASVREANAG